MNLIKTILTNYVTFILKGKLMPKNVSEDVYFGKKKSLEKATKVQLSEFTILTKVQDITIILCERIIDIILLENIKEVYVNTLKNYLLITNA